MSIREVSTEKTPLETAARLLRQALILVETEDDYAQGKALTNLGQPSATTPERKEQE